MAGGARRLIIRPGGIGDTILAFPAMQWLAAQADADCEVWVRREIVPLAGFANRARAIADTGIELFGIEGVKAPARTIEALQSFDEIYSWYGAGRPEFRLELKRLAPRVRFLDALPQQGAGCHAADYFAGQVGAPVPAIPSIRTDSLETHGAIAVHPYSGSAAKNWPMEKFVEVSRALPVEWVAREDGFRFADLGDLARWLAGARAFVGNDSGITHLAAAVGVPVVALFGPTDPAIWAPRGHRVRVIRGASMDDIRVDEVLAAIRML